MKFLSRVVWSEGMHLGPYHFQTQSRYFEDTLWFLNSNLRPHPWGMLHFLIDTEAMKNGYAVLQAASGILPDGLIFDVPDSDPELDRVPLKELFSDTDSEILLHLSIQMRKDQGLDCDLEDGKNSRYSSVQRTLRDESSGQGEYEVSFARKNLRLCSQSQLGKEEVSFPIARVLRDGNGGFISDAEFIPPCLRIGASEGLVSLLQRLVQAIDVKVESVRGERRSSGRFELGTSALDVADYWFLHALCSSLPALHHHLLERRSHPEDVYRSLARLAGALSTFSLEATADKIPRYMHLDLSSTFRGLDTVIRRYLDVVVPPNTISLKFRKSDAYVWMANVADERCLRRCRWIFGIRSSLGEASLLKLVPSLVKICSHRGVLKLIKLALPGLTLLHLPVPPPALHGQADMHYFSVSFGGACWKDIDLTREVGIYIPSEIGEPIFDLTVILETSQ